MKIIDIKTQGSISIIQINNAAKMNIANEQTLLELSGALDTIDQNDDVLGLVITGTDNVFCAGADIKKISNKDTAKEYLKLGRLVFNQLMNIKKVTISAVNGYAFGGGNELAMSSDFIYASKSAVFALPEVKLGLFPGWGGTQILADRINISKAKDLIFTGRKVDAQEALQIGLVDRVFEDNEKLLSGSISFLNSIFENSPDAVYKAKEMINLFYTENFEDALSIENEELAKFSRSNDAVEGMKAFIEKRKPVWRLKKENNENS